MSAGTFLTFIRRATNTLVLAAAVYPLGGIDSATAGGLEDLAAADSAREANEYDKAILLYTSAIDSNELSVDDRAGAYLDRGAVRSRLRLYKLALADFDESLRLKTTPHALLNRGGVYDSLGYFNRAIEDYDRAIHLVPRLWAAYYNRGNAYAHAKRHELAIKDYDKAIDLYPEFSRTYVNRGHEYSALGHDDLALTDYRNAIRVDPNDYSAFIGRGTLYLNNRQYDLAIRNFTKAIRIVPRSDDFYSLRGRAYARAGEFANAADDFVASLTIKLDTFVALSLYLNRERSGSDGHRELIANAKKIGTEKWPGAIAAFYLGRISEQEILAMVKDPDSEEQRKKECEAFYYVGMARLLKGDAKAAEDYFLSAIGTNVTNYLEYTESAIELAKLKREK